MMEKHTIKSTAIITFLLLFSINSFAQVDIARKTKAVTYPQNAEVSLRFRGTTRFPRMKGEAKIERTRKNGTEIQLSVSKMPRPFELGAGYATYVLWAISPNGQVDNLGEIKRRGFWEFDSKIKVTTPLQTFALIVTAEPHFLVSRPSQEIMLENLNPYSRSGKTIPTTTTISYFGNSSDYFRDARTPQIADVDYRRTPTSILQAQQALALAKYAGAERDATKELQQAEVLMKNAKGAWAAGRGEEAVDIAARKAISQAVQAENTARVRKTAREKRNQKIRQDAEIRRAENKYSDAQSTIDDLKSQLASETRARELSERDVSIYLKQIRELKSENAKLRQEVQDTKIKLATTETRYKTLESQREKDGKLRKLQVNSTALKSSLRRFGSVTNSDRGIVLTLSDNYWAGPRVSSFSSNLEAKFNDLTKLLADNKDYKIVIESHSDNRGDSKELLVLTKERAGAIADKLMSMGVTSSSIEVTGFGGSLPIASNNTRSNRAKNRRVQIILIPNIQ